MLIFLLQDAASASQTVTADRLAGTDVSTDFSLVGMFIQADFIVQAVMLLLIVSSVWGWSIIVNTWNRLKAARAASDSFEDRFWSGEPLDSLYKEVEATPGHPIAAVFVAAMREWKRSHKARGRELDKGPLRDRIYKVMTVTLGREMEQLEGQVSYLATIGSAAPFVGLFGTVWGIMNSFQSIARASDTSLATVAPGIAEALLATALGLIAAIPAVVAYNKLSTDLSRYASRMEGFAEEFGAILSRQLDEGES